MIIYYYKKQHNLALLFKSNFIVIMLQLLLIDSELFIHVLNENLGNEQKQILFSPNISSN